MIYLFKDANYLKKISKFFLLSLSTGIFLTFCLSSQVLAIDFKPSQDEIDFIQNAKPIEISYDAYWPPFESYDEETQKIEGINYEILMLIAELTGLEFKFMHGMSYAEALNNLAQGKTHMHLSYDTNPQKAKELNAVLSNTFLQTPIAMIGKNYDISPDSVFAVSKLHPVIIDFVENTFPNNKLLLFEDINSAYQAVEDDIADYTFENVYASRTAISAGGYPLLRIVNIVPVYDKFSFIFNQDVDPRLVSIFNKAIASFPHDKFSNILLNHTTAPSYTSKFLNFLSYASVNLLIGVILLLIILMAVLFIYTAKQRSLKKEIEKKQIQVQSMLDAFPMPIYIADTETYEILYCNKIVYNFFDSHDIISKHCHKILQDRETPCTFCTNDIILQQKHPLVWDQYNKKLGKHLQYVDSCIAWGDKEKVRLSIVTDITDTLNLQKDKVLEQEANVAKGQFLANMSHEIRTPLNGILGMTHLAIDANADAKVGDYLSKMQSSSENLLKIVNDILDFSKIESGKLHLENAPFSLQEALLDAKVNLEIAASKKNIALNHYIDNTIPEYVSGDSLRFTQILFNIAGNAIKFTDKGSVSINLHNHMADKDKVGIRLIIQDTGIGITEKQLKNIFVEFSQADVTTTRIFGGTGLGLSISKRLANLMGGDIRVESEVNKGSTFECTLVFDKTTTSPIQIQQKGIQDIEPFDNLRVLLAEDNEINRIIASELLEKLGCIVTYAEDGIEVMEKIYEQDFDVILMDIQMPRLDGLSASMKIRLDQRFDTVPIIAVSAHAMPEDRFKSIDAGMQEHISKPFKPMELYKVMKHYSLNSFKYNRDK